VNWWEEAVNSNRLSTFQPQDVEYHQWTFLQVWTMFSQQTQLPHNLWRRGHTRLGTTSPPDSSTKNRKVSTLEGGNISGSLTAEELATTLKHLELRKSPGLDSIFPEFILHALSALKSWLCDFLTSACTNSKSKDLERSTNSCDP